MYTYTSTTAFNDKKNCYLTPLRLIPLEFTKKKPKTNVETGDHYYYFCLFPLASRAVNQVHPRMYVTYYIPKVSQGSEGKKCTFSICSSIIHRKYVCVLSNTGSLTCLLGLQSFRRENY